ncbi:MAG TPA: hypothetical protein VGL66_10135 [Caulobacteraceae bacterium]|jgi:hypothetical protein
MSRKPLTLASALAAAIVVLSAAAATAEPPPPPPPPPPGTPPVDDGCSGPATPEQTVKAQVTALSPKDIGIAGDKIGALTWRWGVRVTSDDARLDQISGLELNARLGLLAVTRNGSWLTFDLRRGGLDDIRDVIVEPIRGEHGVPDGLVSEAYDRESVLFEDEPSPRLYRFDLCKFNARGLHETAEAVSINLEIRAAAKRIDGYHLVGVSEADRFTPDYRPGVSDIYSIWRDDRGGPETAVYEDGRAPGLNGPRELARLPHAMTAMFAIYSSSSGKVDLFMAAEVKPGAVDLYRFTVD